MFILPIAASAHEAYFTPAPVVHALFSDPAFPRWGFRGEWIDAGAGQGHLHRVTQEYVLATRWTAVEPFPIGEMPGAPGFDVRWLKVSWIADGPFLSPLVRSHARDAAGIIMNPPFSLAESFVRAALEETRAVVICLQRRGWIDEARASFFREYPPDEYVIPWRIRFLRPDGTMHAPFPGLCSWFVWPPHRDRSSGTLRLLKGLSE